MVGKQSQAMQALDPLRPGLTQPWKDYVTRGLITVYTEFSPTGTSVYCILLRDLALPQGIDKSRVPLGIARDVIKGANLDGQTKGKGKAETVKSPPKPLRSLHVSEFQNEPEVLISRIRSVAKAIANKTAYGRISSAGLLKEGASDFGSWWTAATAQERAAVFILKKDLEAANANDLSKVVEVFSNLQCPFRGSLVQQAEQEEATEEAPAATSQAPRRSNAVRVPSGNAPNGDK